MEISDGENDDESEPSGPSRLTLKFEEVSADPHIVSRDRVPETKPQEVLRSSAGAWAKSQDDQVQLGYFSQLSLQASQWWRASARCTLHTECYEGLGSVYQFHGRWRRSHEF